MGAIELRASRWKEGWRLLLATILLAGTIFVLSTNDGSGDTQDAQSWQAWTFLIFCLAAFIIFGWQFIKPPRLIMDERGFLYTGRLRAPQEVKWQDIEKFFVFYTGRGNQFIAYDLKPEARSNSILAKANHHFGADGTLPSVWPISAESLADKLNAVRQGGLGETSFD